MAPRLAAHESAIYLHPALFARIDALHARRDALGLDAGAAAPARARAPRLRARRRQRSRRPRSSGTPRSSSGWPTLTTQFAQNVLADEAGFQLVLRSEADLAGLPGCVRDSARQAARERGATADAWVITLSSLVGRAVPHLFGAARPARAGVARLDRRAASTRATTTTGRWSPRSCALRQRAGAPARLRELRRLRAGRPHGRHAGRGRRRCSQRVWAPAKARAGGRARSELAGAGAGTRRDRADRALGLALLGREGARSRAIASTTPRSSRTSRSTRMTAGDVRLRAAPVRHRASSRSPDLRPTTRTCRSTRCATATASRSASSCRQLRAPEQAQRRLDERRTGCSRAIGGARAADRRQQQQLRQGARPGEPTLLSLDDARTLFHEFGHGLHGLLSDVRYERLSGTQRAARLRRAAVAAVRALAARAGGAGAPRAPPRAPASRFPTTLIEQLARGAPLQPGLRDGASTPRRALVDMAAARAAPSAAGSTSVAFERRGARSAIGVPREHRAAPPAAALPAPVLGRRLRGRLLRLPVGRGARRRRLRRLRRGGRPVRPRASRSGCGVSSTARATRWSRAPRIARSAGAIPTVEPMLRKKGLLATGAA